MFSRYTARGNVDLYTMNPDGSGMKELTRTGTNELWPQWARAGFGPDRMVVAGPLRKPSCLALALLNVISGAASSTASTDLRDRL